MRCSSTAAEKGKGMVMMRRKGVVVEGREGLVGERFAPVVR